MEFVAGTIDRYCDFSKSLPELTVATAFRHVLPKPCGLHYGGKPGWVVVLRLSVLQFMEIEILFTKQGSIHPGFCGCLLFVIQGVCG